jgi:hypothetical protein
LVATEHANLLAHLLLILAGGLLMLGILAMAPRDSVGPGVTAAEWVAASPPALATSEPAQPNDPDASDSAGNGRSAMRPGWPRGASPPRMGQGDARSYLMETSAQQRLRILPRANRAELTR